MADQAPPMETLLPHRRPMLLIDAVVSSGPESLTARVTVGPDSMFLEGDAVPAHIAVEYMAQACAAYAGMQALAAGEAVRIGFLLGTRRCLLHRDAFRLGETLEIAVAATYRDETMASFDCSIRVAGELAAEAQLAVHQPAEDSPVLQRLRNG